MVNRTTGVVFAIDSAARHSFSRDGSTVGTRAISGKRRVLLPGRGLSRRVLLRARRREHRPSARRHERPHLLDPDLRTGRGRGLQRRPIRRRRHPVRPQHPRPARRTLERSHFVHARRDSRPRRRLPRPAGRSRTADDRRTTATIDATTGTIEETAAVPRARPRGRGRSFAARICLCSSESPIRPPKAGSTTSCAITGRRRISNASSGTAPSTAIRSR